MAGPRAGPRAGPGPGPRPTGGRTAERALGPGPGPFAKLLNEFVSQRSYFLLASLNYLMNLFPRRSYFLLASLSRIYVSRIHVSRISVSGALYSVSRISHVSRIALRVFHVKEPLSPSHILGSVSQTFRRCGGISLWRNAQLR